METRNLLTRTAWRLLAAASLAVAIGAVHLATVRGEVYSDGGARALYMGPVGVEHDMRNPLHISVWSCDEGGIRWRCPLDEVTASIRVGAPGVADYPGTAVTYGQGWQPLTPAMARQVRRGDAADPASCTYWWPAEDSLMIRCAGVAVAS
jgi:hypothetical protein